MEINGADKLVDNYSDDQMIVIPEGNIVQRDDRIHSVWKTHINSFLPAGIDDLGFRVAKSF